MESQDDLPIPASLRSAWGLRERSGRGPKPGLTLERLVAAAVEVARAEGLGAVSMARVAQRLGVSTMALYRYVDAKDELLPLMVDVAVGHPPDGAAADWRAGLARWALAYRQRIRENTWAVRVPITGLPSTPNQVAWFENALAALRETRLSEEEKASVILLLSSYVRSEATLTADLIEAGGISDAAMAGYVRLLATVAQPERFPALHALLASGVFDRADPPEKEFAFGLERILDGVEVLIAQR